MVRRLRNKQFTMLKKDINATKNGNIFRVVINETTGVEMDYYPKTGTFDICIAELPFEDYTKDVGSYSHAFPPCLIPTAIRLMKDYVEEHGGTFQTLRKYERENDKNFFEYFEKRTGIPYDDLIMYKP